MASYPSVGPLLARARMLAAGAPCLLRAVCAVSASAAASEGDGIACAHALQVCLGAAAAAEARYALATAAMGSTGVGDDAASAMTAADIAAAAQTLQHAEENEGSTTWRSLLTHTPPLDGGAIVTLCVADAAGVTAAGVAPSSSGPASRLVITRVDASHSGGISSPPLVLTLPIPTRSSSSRGDAQHTLGWGVTELRSVLEESDACRQAECSTEAQKRAWWAARLALDARMHALCAAMDSHWLGAWRVALHGAPQKGSLAALATAAAFDAAIAELPAQCRTCPHMGAAMRLLAQAAATGVATREELVGAVEQLHNGTVCDVDAVVAAMLDAATAPPQPAARSSTGRGAASRRGGAAAQPSSGNSQKTEKKLSAAPPGPVLLMLDAALTALPWESMPGVAGQRISRAPSLGLVALSLHLHRHGPSPSMPPPSVDLSHAYFLLNPGGDLPGTQARLHPLLSGQPGWGGAAGGLPAGGKAAHAAKLASSPLFLYFGHGAGTQFLPHAALRLRRCSTALALLMGCSSGALVPKGDFPPSGAALAYLAAGCASLVANLWDVTDKDIDRFAESLLNAWLQAVPADEGAVRRHGSSGESALVHTGMEDARRACKLRALTGAAPVCYGLPLLLTRATGEDDGQRAI